MINDETRRKLRELGMNEFVEILDVQQNDPFTVSLSSMNGSLRIFQRKKHILYLNSLNGVMTAAQQSSVPNTGKKTGLIVLVIMYTLKQLQTESYIMPSGLIWVTGI